MSDIQGLKIKNISFSHLARVGVLFYAEFPSTLIYADNNGTPFVLEWVDCDETGMVDKYLLFETTKSKLAKFLAADISHLNFIKTSIKEYITYIEGSLETPLNPSLLAFSDIPDDFLPAKGIFFNKDESVQLAEIIDYFDLRLFKHSLDLNIESASETDQVVGHNKVIRRLHSTKIIAEKQLRQVFNIHLLEGKDIRFGVANTLVLGNVLTSFDALYRATALDVYEGVSRSNIISFNSKRTKALLPKITTEVFLQEAASFSLFIRPMVSNQQMRFDNSSEIDVVSDRLFSLLFNSDSREKLEFSFNQYSSFVFKSYIDFLTVIKENDLNVNYSFYSPFSKAEYESELDTKRAWEILDFIDQLSLNEVDTYSLTVKFTALNCNTGHYYCESNDKQIYSGHFDILLRDSMPTLNFTDLYNVAIQRKITKITGRMDPKIEDVILSCLKK